MNKLRQIKALYKIRLLLLLNNIKSKAGLGKIIGMGLAALVMILTTASGASDLLEGIFKLPYADIIAEWGIGLLVLYGIFIVFTGDLVSGHTLNAGQMSSDFHYLSTLPISPIIVIFVKIFDRLITDYFGILFLLPALIGISCHRAYTLNAFFAAFLLFFEVSILIGLLINLVNICLTRFFKTSTINNFYSIFGYISAILTLIPFLILSEFKPAYISTILEKLGYIQEKADWLVEPIRWLAVPLLRSTPLCIEFGKLTIIWLVFVALFTFIFHLTIKNNWFAFVHSNKAVSNSFFSKKLFSGLFWKEWLMVKSDLNLLVNAILMPISIIAMEVYFLKQVFSFTSMYSIMNFIFGSIIYFSLFGPINIIGYESKAISILESLPITPAQLLKRKYSFWLMVALIIFIPSTIATFKIMFFDWEVTLKATLLTTLFTIASVWVTVCFSAIFAKYDTTVLQQHSTFFGKMGAMFVMTMLLPLKNFSWLNFYTLLLFIMITYLCYMKAQICIAYRQDKETLESEPNLTINCSILLLSFAVIENSIRQLFNSVVPDTDTGIWAWCLALAAMFFFVILGRKKKTPFFPKITKNSIFRVLIINIISVALTVGYFALNSDALTNMKSDVSQIISFFAIINVVKPIWSVVVFALFTIFYVALTRRVEENFFTNSSNIFWQILGIGLICLLTTKNIVLPVLFFLFVLQLLKTKENKQSIVCYSSFLYYSFLAIYFFYRLP